MYGNIPCRSLNKLTAKEAGKELAAIIAPHEAQLYGCNGSLTTRNAPSAGTERIDRIEKCHSGLCNSIVFSSKTVLLLVISVHDILTRLCTYPF